MIYFLKRRILSSCTGRKSGVLEADKAKKWGAFGVGDGGRVHTRTVPIWEYPWDYMQCTAFLYQFTPEQ